MAWAWIVLLVIVPTILFGIPGFAISLTCLAFDAATTKGKLPFTYLLGYVVGHLLTASYIRIRSLFNPYGQQESELKVNEKLANLQSIQNANENSNDKCASVIRSDLSKSDANSEQSPKSSLWKTAPSSTNPHLLANLFENNNTSNTKSRIAVKNIN